jgi:hypothetical protein
MNKTFTKTLAIATGYTGVITLLAESDVDTYIIAPASPCVLGGAATITITGTVRKGHKIHFIMNNPVTIGAFTFTILGTAIPENQMASGFDLLCEYDGAAWVPFLRQDFLKTAFIGGDKLAAAIVDGSTIEIASNTLRVKAGGITLAKLQNLGSGAKLLLSDVSGDLQIIALSGDVTIDAAGAVTIGNDKVTTAKILNANVTLDKMAAVAEGSLLIGDANSRPVAISCKTSGYLLLGNGTTAIAVTLSGDVTIAANGAVTIANNAVTTVKMLDGNVTLPKIANIGAAKIIVGNVSGIPTAVDLSGDATITNAGVLAIGASKVVNSMIADGAISPAKLGISNPSTGLYEGLLSVKTLNSTQLKALLDGVAHDLFSVKAGETVMAVHVYVQTPHGAPSTLNIGVDAQARTAGAVADGITKTADLATAGIYKSDDESYYGTLQKFGFFVADAAGYLTIQSSIDCSSGAFVGSALMLYIAKGA